MGIALVGSIVALLGACSSKNDTSASSDSDAAACTLLAASYDHRCTVDSDCVLVPPGGNVCNAEVNLEGALFCDFSAVSVAAAPAYRRALSATFYETDGVTPSPGHFGSCPNVATKASCNQGQCVSNACAASGGVCVSPSSSNDAGAVYSASCAYNPFPCNGDGYLCC